MESYGIDNKLLKLIGEKMLCTRRLVYSFTPIAFPKLEVKIRTHEGECCLKTT